MATNKEFFRRVVRLLLDPRRLSPAIKRRLWLRSLSKNILTELFSDDTEYETYKQELLNSGLLEELDKRLQEFNDVSGKTNRGDKFANGVMSTDEGFALYALTRKLKPEKIVETGVCNGYSSALILQALHQNQTGQLYSIDFPEVAGATYEAGVFWDGKGGAVIPPDKSSGWIIPERLLDKWELRQGKSQDLLPPLLDELKTIDIFIHDSEHSYECMMFEYMTAYPFIRQNGLLVSDDILWNKAFFDFAKKHHRKAGQISGSMGVIVKQ